MSTISYRIMGIVPGPYSGVSEYLFTTLAKRHSIVKIFDSSLNKPLRYYSHLKSYIGTAIALRDLPSHPNQWLHLTDKNEWRWRKETELCEREITRQKDNVDFVLQIGSKHGVCKKEPLCHTLSIWMVQELLQKRGIQYVGCGRLKQKKPRE